jgi:hypothetical protein
MLLGMSTSLAFAIAARRTLALRPAPGRGRFWFGIACGLAAQTILLTVTRASVTGWVPLLLAGAGAVAAFYLVRAIFGLLSPEEEQLLQRLAAANGRQENSERWPCCRLNAPWAALQSTAPAASVLNPCSNSSLRASLPPAVELPADAGESGGLP